MKRIYLIFMFAVSAALVTIGGCKKDQNNDADLASDVVAYQTDDHARVSAEDDAVSDDINANMETDPIFGGRGTQTDTTIICDATITRDTTAGNRGIVIVYNGTNCRGNRTRTGTVRVTLPAGTKWKDAGAQLTVTIQNLKITRLSDNKSLTLNGTKTMTNVTGHLLRELATSGPIVHTITSSNMTATFDNGTSRQWQIAKKRTFSYSNGVVISEEGTHTDNGVSDIAVWGTNRLGQDFSTRIVSALVVRQDCNFRLVSGKVEHTRLARPITVTFGLDSAGNATGCPGTGNYYYKAEWTSLTGTPHSIIQPY